MVRHNSVVYASVFLLMFGVGMIMAQLPQTIIFMSGSASSAGYLASAFALTFVLVQIPMGQLSDRFGFKPFLILGYAVCGASGVLYYLADSTGTVLIGRMLQGVGEVPVWTLAPALLAVQHPGKKGTFIGLYNAALHLGLTAGSFSGIWTAGVWKNGEAFIVFAVACFLGGILMALFLHQPSRKRFEPSGKDLSAVLGNAGNQSLFAGILLYGAGYGLFVTMIPGFLMRVKGYVQADLGLFFMLFYIGVSLAQVVGGPVSDRVGQKPVMLAGLAMAAAGLSFFTTLSGTWLLLLLTLSALGLGTFCVSALSFLNGRVPDAVKGTLSGCFYFFWGAGYFSGPLLLGWLGHPGQWPAGFQALGGLLAAVMMVIWAVLRSENLSEPMPVRVK